MVEIHVADCVFDVGKQVPSPRTNGMLRLSAMDRAKLVDRGHEQENVTRIKKAAYLVFFASSWHDKSLAKGSLETICEKYNTPLTSNAWAARWPSSPNAS